MNYCDEIATTMQNGRALNIRVRNGEKHLRLELSRLEQHESDLQRRAADAFAKLNGWKLSRAPFAASVLARDSTQRKRHEAWDEGWVHDLFDHPVYFRETRPPYRPGRHRRPALQHGCRQRSRDRHADRARPPRAAKSHSLVVVSRCDPVLLLHPGGTGRSVPAGSMCPVPNITVADLQHIVPLERPLGWPDTPDTGHPYRRMSVRPAVPLRRTHRTGRTIKQCPDVSVRAVPDLFALEVAPSHGLLRIAGKKFWPW
jgi:hypothetical protein